jgi:hypothetical protein
MESTVADFQAFQSLGFLYALPMGTNMYRVYMGGYSNKMEADQAVQTLKSRGYQDAATVELDPAKGKQVAVIQMGTKNMGQEFSWDAYKKAGPIYVFLQDKQVHITSAPYSDMVAAKAQLESIRKMGHREAFIRNVNSVFLREINSFYPDAVYTPPVETPALAPAPPDIPQVYSMPSEPAVKTIPQDVPTSYSQPSVPAAPKALSAAPSLAPKPKIRSQVKRNSALELQKLLKESGHYASAVDGLYGAGTASAYETAYRENRQIQKYSVLAANLPTGPAPAAPGSLQHAINTLADNPAEALAILQARSIPVSKVYQAYYSLATEGPSSKVNDLMNSAIMEAYIKAVRPAATRFDYTSTYAYNDLTQLINHLAYVQVIATPAVYTPCWLLQRHPEEAVRAFTPDPALPNANYSLPDCGGFMEWPEIRTLVSIARDLQGGEQASEQALAQGKSDAMRYLLQPKALSAAEQKSADTWHTMMIASVSAWASRDPMLTDIGNSYRMLYFQSYVLLEDYYMDKGLKAADSKGLAQATLKSLVGPYMTRFM